MTVFPFLFNGNTSKKDDGFSVPYSCTPEENTVLLNGNAAHYTVRGGSPVSEAASVFGFSGKLCFNISSAKLYPFNYYGICYTSNSFLKGTVTYKTLFGIVSEEFFIEPATKPTEFFSLTDGYMQNRLGLKILSVSFEALNTERAQLGFYGIGCFNRKVYDSEIFIRNSSLKLGVSLSWGGALSYLEDLDSNVQAVCRDGIIKVDSNACERYSLPSVNNNVNLINRNDTGRLIQQSYYGTGNCEQYSSAEFMGNSWRYNPVQGGNVFNEESKIIDVRISETSVFIKCRPLDWAKSAEYITPSYMEAQYTLDGSTVSVHCRFIDYSGYPEESADQELPAFYPVEPLNNFVYYTGSNPWTGEAVTSEKALIFWPDAGYPRFGTSENWFAFTGEFDDSFGIGLYSTDAHSVLAGIYNRDKTKNTDPSRDPATSYVAVVKKLTIKSFEPVEYNYVIATGTAQQIRDSFYNIANVD